MDTFLSALDLLARWDVIAALLIVSGILLMKLASPSE